MDYALKAVASPADWQAMHDIRRAVLFAPGRHKVDVTYDANHPHDRMEGHVPFLLLGDGAPIGVVRLDAKGELGVVRLVAIVAAEQRQGHGRMLDTLVTDEARRRGIRLLRVNAAPTAVGFYEKTGWRREEWDHAELVGLASDCVQMVKPI